MIAQRITAARGRRIVAGLACLALVVGLITNVTGSRGFFSGTNSISARADVADLQAGQEICQKEAVVPAGTRSLTLGARTNQPPPVTGPRLDVTVKTPSGTPVTRGRLPAGFADTGSVNIPLEPVTKTAPSAIVCIRDGGPGPISLYGSLTSEPAQLFVGKQQLSGLLTVVWYGQEKNWLQQAPAIAHHADTGGTQVLGSLTLWLTLGFVLVGAAAALFVTLRESDA